MAIATTLVQTVQNGIGLPDIHKHSCRNEGVTVYYIVPSMTETMERTLTDINIASKRVKIELFGDTDREKPSPVSHRGSFGLDQQNSRKEERLWKKYTIRNFHAMLTTGLRSKYRRMKPGQNHRRN